MELNKPILIADDMHPALMQGLEQARIAFRYEPSISRTELIASLPEIEGLVVRSKIHLTRELLQLASHLKFIARAGAGMDNINTVAAAELGIKCINAPEGNRDAVGEHALGLLLGLTRNINRSYSEVQKGQWQREENRGEELTEMTIGIIGFGHTGQSFARKISGLGCEVLYFDKFNSGVPTPYAKEALLDEVYRRANVLSFHIPLEQGNEGLINRKLIESVVQPFYLLNLSRGGIMKTKDVLWGLENGRIKAAGLDVLENEKPDQWTPEERELMHQLNATGRVIITPHIGGWTFSSYRKISEVLLSKILTMLS
ncbi:MAG: phosphoglycerate dehydrogenase [Bacteroidota bacterium]|nr:phosphoglycerate dehydrogenase [Bacteroidota bacterium]MDX5430366.1 phosphoglycerate dehydrogenase [Bacteroidota bacterium]MDX5469127.1 phosphoglycerate dehydrogenase [Bacteroidota bacterium]